MLWFKCLTSFNNHKYFCGWGKATSYHCETTTNRIIQGDQRKLPTKKRKISLIAVIRWMKHNIESTNSLKILRVAQIQFLIFWQFCTGITRTSTETYYDDAELDAVWQYIVQGSFYQPKEISGKISFMCNAAQWSALIPKMRTLCMFGNLATTSTITASVLRKSIGFW